MKQLKILTCALALASTVSVAGDPVSDSDRPSFSASRTLTLAAEVTAVDHETRNVTLKGADGESISFTASEHVRNLAQVEAGDLVLAEVYEEIEITVHANPEGLEPAVGEMAALGRAEEGTMPAGMAQGTVVITAVVEEIDLEANTFKLRGPEGNVKQFAARNPENLRRAEVGDLVVISITQALGIMVERPAEG